MKLSKLDLFLLCTNLVALGGLGVLIALRGPSGPTILVAVGSALMVAAKLGQSIYCKDATAPDPGREAGG